jgi:hypothetical protein
MTRLAALAREAGEPALPPVMPAPCHLIGPEEGVLIVYEEPAAVAIADPAGQRSETAVKLQALRAAQVEARRRTLRQHEDHDVILM